MPSKSYNMNFKFYILFAALFIIISCESEIKSDDNPTKKETSSAQNISGPVFNMVEKSNSSVSVTNADTIDINSIADLVSKANHNTALRLKKGKYELHENLVYYISNEKKEVINKNETENRSVGGQVYISGMTNLSIIGNGSEIFSKNPKAVPLYILNASQSEVRDLSLGHKISSKLRSVVPSLYVSKSNKINFSNCKLGNNSKSGLKIQNSKFITFTDCNISKAHSQVMEVIQGKSIQFVNSTIQNNECDRGCFNLLGIENSIEFKNLDVRDNRSVGETTNKVNRLINGLSENIRFRNCKFYGNNNFDQLGIDDSKLTDCKVQKF